MIYDIQPYWKLNYNLNTRNRCIPCLHYDPYSVLWMVKIQFCHFLDFFLHFHKIITFSPLGPETPGTPSVPGKPGKPYSQKELDQIISSCWFDWTEHFIHDSDSLRGWENYFVSGHNYNDTYRLTGCSILSWWSKCPRSKSCACSRRTRRTRGARRTWQAWQSLQQQEKNHFSKFTTIYGVFRFLLQS